MQLKTRIIFGQFEEELRRLDLSGRGLLCCRRGFGGGLGWLDLRTIRVSPEPTLEDAERCWDELAGENFDYVLAVGGGSVLDMAKILAARMVNPGPIEGFLGVDRIENPPKPVIAVPTTHGTGSEVTKYAVLRVSGGKTSVVSEKICPSVAVVDPALTLGLPKELTIYTSIDALCHNLEAYFTRFADPLVDLICEDGVRLFFEGIEGAIADELQGRRKLMLCSVLGGVAITNTQTFLVHALSHVLGGRFGVPHGMANSLFLRAFLEFCRGDEKFGLLERRLGLDLIAELDAFYRRHSLKGLSDFVDEREALELAGRAYANRRLVEGGRMKAGKEDLEGIVLRSLRS
jgi:alcohol dehydrogenase class IV